MKRYLPSDRVSKFEWEVAGQPSSSRGKCVSCMNRGFDVRWCSNCKEHLPRNRFATGRMWAEHDDSVRKCDKCQGKQRGMWFCKSCQKRKATEEFRMWTTAKGQKKNDGTAQCHECWQKERDIPRSECGQRRRVRNEMMEQRDMMSVDEVMPRQ